MVEPVPILGWTVAVLAVLAGGALALLWAVLEYLTPAKLWAKT